MNPHAFIQVQHDAATICLVIHPYYKLRHSLTPFALSLSEAAFDAILSKSKLDPTILSAADKSQIGFCVIVITGRKSSHHLARMCIENIDRIFPSDQADTILDPEGVMSMA